MRPKLLVGPFRVHAVEPDAKARGRQTAVRSEAHTFSEARGGSRADLSRTRERLQLFPSQTFPGNRVIECVGCDIVQADHAPEAGVAQGIFHGILVRHHGRNQEEVEEGLENKVERHEEEDNTQEQVRMPRTMDGNEDTQTRLGPHVTVYA